MLNFLRYFKGKISTQSDSMETTARWEIFPKPMVAVEPPPMNSG